jgi:hypothetical protein
MSEKRQLQWRGRHGGRKVGDVIHLDQREWLVVTGASQPKTRRLTEGDEDMGNGVAGDTITTQDVSVRVASAEEVATEPHRRASVEAAKRAATADGQLKAWLEETGAISVPYERGLEINRSGVSWQQLAVDRTRSGQPHRSVAVGVLPTGAPVAKVYTYDMPEQYYEVVDANEQAVREQAALVAERRAAFEFAAEYGVLSAIENAQRGTADERKLAALQAGPASPEEHALYAAGLEIDRKRAFVLEAWRIMTETGVAGPVLSAGVTALWSDTQLRVSLRSQFNLQYGKVNDDPSVLHLFRAAERAVATGLPVAWGPWWVVYALTYKDPSGRSAPLPLVPSVAAQLEARGLGSLLKPYGARLDDPSVLAALDAWCDSLNAPRVTGEARAKLLERQLVGVRAKIEKLTAAQQAILTAASDMAARTTGLELGGRQKASAAKVVAAGLGALDGAGRFWLAPETELALGLPRIERDELMRRRELEGRKS